MYSEKKKCNKTGKHNINQTGICSGHRILLKIPPFLLHTRRLSVHGTWQVGRFKHLGELVTNASVSLCNPRLTPWCSDLGSVEAMPSVAGLLGLLGVEDSSS